MIKAYKTIACDISSIVYSKNAGIARYTTMLSANNAGYAVELIQIKCRRIPELDHAKFGGMKPPENLCIDPKLLVK